MSLAWDLPLSSTEKLVLLALADCANDEGECWPSIATIGRKACIGERSVQRSIQSLKDAGHLTRIEVTGKGCRYIIHPRQNGTPATKSPVTQVSAPPPQSHPTPATVAPKPSMNHQEPSKVKSSDDDAPLSVKELVQDWNDFAKPLGLPLVVVLSDARKKKAASRLKRFPDVKLWQRAFASIRGSPFCLGENERGWKADFDFLLQDKSFAKLIEGSYGTV